MEKNHTLPSLRSGLEENIMPIYSYKCPECDHEQSIVRKVSDSTDQLCSSCGAISHRKLKTSGFSISGEGVYKEGFSGYNVKTKIKGDKYDGK